MLNAEEWATLLDTLLARSKSGDVKWHEKVDGALEVDLGKENKMQILSIDRDGNAPYLLTVLHRDPWTEKFTAFAELNSDDGPNWRANRDLLSELYIMVKRQVGGVANVYNGLLEALGGPVESAESAPTKQSSETPKSSWGAPETDPWGKPAPNTWGNEPPF